MSRTAGRPGDRSTPDPEIDAGPDLSARVSDRLRSSVSEAAASGHHVVRVRLDRVATFDTSGLGLLVGLHRLARTEGLRLVLVSPTAMLFAVMRRRGLHRVIPVEFDIRLTEHRGSRPTN